MLDTFGLELLQKAYSSEICKKEDVIILLLHWYLAKSGYQCIGIGDSKDFNESEEGSELLPEGWNTGPSYSIRYLKNKELHVLLGIKSGTDLLLNFVIYKKNHISNITFPIEETVSALQGPFASMIPSYKTVLQKAKDEFSLESAKEAETQTNKHDPGTNNLRIAVVDRITNDVPLSRQPNIPPEHDPLRVGMRDLDPLARGGGMIFDPIPHRLPVHATGPFIGMPGILPRGAIPPGARFNPIGPLAPPNMDDRRNRQPGNDHLPPPHFHDMYM